LIPFSKGKGLKRIREDFLGDFWHFNVHLPLNPNRKKPQGTKSLTEQTTGYHNAKIFLSGYQRGIAPNHRVPNCNLPLIYYPYSLLFQLPPWPKFINCTLQYWWCNLLHHSFQLETSRGFWIPHLLKEKINYLHPYHHYKSERTRLQKATESNNNYSIVNHKKGEV